MSENERSYEARARAITYFAYGGLPFVDRVAVLAVVVDAEDEIERLADAYREAVEALESLRLLVDASGDGNLGSPWDTDALVKLAKGVRAALTRLAQSPSGPGEATG
jgi:hypothetical protein